MKFLKIVMIASLSLSSLAWADVKFCVEDNGENEGNEICFWTKIDSGKRVDFVSLRLANSTKSKVFRLLKGEYEVCGGGYDGNFCFEYKFEVAPEAGQNRNGAKAILELKADSDYTSASIHASLIEQNDSTFEFWAEVGEEESSKILDMFEKFSNAK